MAFEKSNEDSLERSRRQVTAIRRIVEHHLLHGKKVHFVWDVDHVLVSGRSDDAFALLGYDVDKYFTYEERLLFEPLEPGPWAGLAMECGDLHHTQDIVTARSSYLAMRVMYFLIAKKILTRWQLFVGHQSKRESFRIILDSLKQDADTFIIYVDDAQKHVETFRALTEELGMADRCLGVLAHQVREYSEDELRHEISEVSRGKGSTPFLVRVFCSETGLVKRQVQVTPDPAKSLREMFWEGFFRHHRDAVIQESRPQLLKMAKELMGIEWPTDDQLYLLWDITRQP